MPKDVLYGQLLAFPLVLEEYAISHLNQNIDLPHHGSFFRARAESFIAAAETSDREGLAETVAALFYAARWEEIKISNVAYRE